MNKAGRFEEWDPGDEGTDSLPNSAGIYRLHVNDRLAYIGISSNLSARLRQYERAGILELVDHVSYRVVHGNTSFESLREWEREQIDKHNPPGNQRGGGGGRTPR
jgi:excinuclease UvrABC nuclease subunit